ncbi:auxin-responsive protein IAA10-like [Iris pallida]|uniref:Auxin-responsive protein n=1 Tax=Iris pallida TaxID=29817 RepID=A0AAX6HQV1_IRIPA|nr:auxin-responsive protein IAA10-like [Iris pallida]
MMSSEVSSAAAMKEVEVEVEVEEEELELGLSLGANNNSTSRKQYCCRILTAKDFPSPAAAASPMSPSSSVSSSGIDRAPPPPSHQVVGWPPIRTFRMNSLVTQSKDNTSHDADTPNLKKSNHSLGVCNGSVGIKNHDKKRGGHALHAAASRFVKVNKDGDPIGRKVDLGAHASYETLATALELMFRKPTAVLISPSENSMKASKLLDGSSEFALTYEDKDGDWMLVGDVPYRMFLDTVKRLRIMRTSDANGLAPRFQSSTGVS